MSADQFVALMPALTVLAAFIGLAFETWRGGPEP